MREEGNGNPIVCANNLIRLTAGEVPYDRTRGMDADLVDAPVTEEGYIAEVEIMLEEFEPRVEIETPEGEDIAEGDMSTYIRVAAGEDEEDGEEEL